MESRVFVAADDAIAKRIVIRTAGAGERVCVHTRDHKRWASVRMPAVSVVGTARPALRTTVSVVEHATRPKGGGAPDGVSDIRDIAISPAPWPATVITIAPGGTALPDGHGHAFEVAIEQVSGAMVKVTAGGQHWLVDMDLFRAENRYVNLESVAMSFANAVWHSGARSRRSRPRAMRTRSTNSSP